MPNLINNNDGWGYDDLRIFVDKDYSNDYYFSFTCLNSTLKNSYFIPYTSEEKEFYNYKNNENKTIFVIYQKD